ncbi:MAG TPA: serine/threonine-protein kinase [Candidatus Dormibacteraeota bacterium]|jgi:serine/threonine-protein kinase|nr:serine/threonine-protein kinase [Candidatus Dormibacteraeota bacterium]
MTSTSSLQPGSQLDQFKIVDVIGHGAFSEVLLAEDREGRRVVLKCPHDSIIGDTATFDRFRRELEIARKLNHPGIQRSYDLSEHRSRPYLVMEYVEGETLRAVLAREKRLPTARAIDVTEQIADAMAYAHGQGVYHRDLKPENILVTAANRVVVTDFGIALMAGARRLTYRWFTSAVGTPDYMAPEQIQGKRGDARTDIYAIGVMLYEMLAGRVPWEGDNPLSVMSQHLSAPVPPLHAINPGVLAPLEAIVRKCLRKKPEERYQDAGALLHDLKHWKDLDLSQFIFPDEAPLRPETQRGLWLLIAALSFGFLAATAAAAYLYYLLTHAH